MLIVCRLADKFPPRLRRLPSREIQDSLQQPALIFISVASAMSAGDIVDVFIRLCRFRNSITPSAMLLFARLFRRPPIPRCAFHAELRLILTSMRHLATACLRWLMSKKRRGLVYTPDQVAQMTL